MELPDNFWNPGESYADKLASSIAADMERNAMLASEKFDRDLEQHDAIMSMADNFDQTVQDVSELKGDVSELKGNVSGISMQITLLKTRADELEQKYEAEKRRAEEAEKKHLRKEHAFQIWLVILSCLLAPDPLKFIFQIIQDVIARLRS